MTPKLCKDCKWCSFSDILENDAKYANCLCPKSKDVQRSIELRKVLGSEKEIEIDHHDGISCYFQRNRNWIESLIMGPYCTKSGKWFEPKEEIK